MGKIPNWERWKEKENMNSTVKKAWTHSILRDLYRGAETEWNIQITDTRKSEELDDDLFSRWTVTIYSSTIDEPGSFKEVGFETLEEAEEYAVTWMRNNPLNSELGWMTLAGHDDEEYLEERAEHYRDRGIETRIVESDADNDLKELQVDTEDFIDAGFRLG